MTTTEGEQAKPGRRARVGASFRGFFIDDPTAPAIPKAPPSAGWRGDPLLGFFAEHTATATALVLGTAAAYVVIVAARGSVDIGLAILSAAGVPAIVGGTALALVPFVMPLVFAGLWVWMASQRGSPLGFTALVVTALMLFMLAITPVLVLLVYLGYAIYYGIQRRRAKLAYRANPSHERLKAVHESEVGERVVGAAIVLALGLRIRAEALAAVGGYQPSGRPGNHRVRADGGGRLDSPPELHAPVRDLGQVRRDHLASTLLNRPDLPHDHRVHLGSRPALPACPR